MKTERKRCPKGRGLRLPCVLAAVILVLFTAPAIHARYGSRDGGSANARVAAFQVSLGEPELRTGDSAAEGPGDPVIYSIRLRNGSECAVDYVLKLVNGARKTVDYAITESEGRLAIGEEKTVLVSLSVPEETFLQMTESEEIRGISVEAVFTQADPGGAS